MIESKRIVIKHIGPISVMGNVQGPILQPFTASINDIMHLIVTGHKTFEVLDNGTHLRLTLENYKKDNNKNTKKAKVQQESIPAYSRVVEAAEEKIEEKVEKIEEVVADEEISDVVETEEVKTEDKPNQNNNNRNNHNNNYKKNKNK